MPPPSCLPRDLIWQLPSMLKTLESVAQILPLHNKGQNSPYQHQDVLSEIRNMFWFEVIFYPV